MNNRRQASATRIPEEKGSFIPGNFNLQKFIFLKEKVAKNSSLARLIGEFEAFKEGEKTDFNRLLSLCDEISVATWVFSQFEDSLEEVIYEPHLPNNQSIDFCVKTRDGRSIYFDVKTVQPKNSDREMRTSRERMLEHTTGLEKKIASIGKKEKNIFVLLLCSSAIHKSDLEDFANFYFAGNHRADDPWGRMESHFVKEAKISLDRTIDYFVHMERGGPGGPIPDPASTERFAREFVNAEREVSKYIAEVQGLYKAPDRFTKFGRYKNVYLPEFSKHQATEQQISDAREKLVAAYHPSAIYLFGSYAWGVKVPDEESDLDFMVIIKDELEGKRLRRSMKGRKALAHFPFPKDIVVYTEEEFRRAAAFPSSLCHVVKNYGRLLA